MKKIVKFGVLLLLISVFVSCHCSNVRINEIIKRGKL